MKKYTWLFLLLLPFSSFGQNKQQKPHHLTEDEAERSVQWRTVKPYKYSDIKKKFPFNKSASIVLVSFNQPTTKDEPRPQPAGIDTLGHYNVYEIVVLNKAQEEKLALLFYNLMCATTIRVIGACYDPRNAIVFLDKDGHIVAELEVCFECHGYEMRPHDFHVGDMCLGRYDALKNFFANADIKYGVTKKE